jgi:hypothetical protein
MPSPPLLLGIPQLSSKPGARNVLYLDFNGYVAPSTSEWGAFTARAYSRDSDFTTFSAAEQSDILGVWRRVTEDFAPFQYDVTTVRSGGWARASLILCGWARSLSLVPTNRTACLVP